MGTSFKSAFFHAKSKDKTMVELQPVECNLCGGKVIYTSNAKIYGREYGSGRMYYCTVCGAYVGTHIPRPREAFGILANQEMRDMKQLCHKLFDEQWIHKKTIKEKKHARKQAYRSLAKALNIEESECHFGYFDMEMLHKAYKVLSESNAK